MRRSHRWLALGTLALAAPAATARAQGPLDGVPGAVAPAGGSLGLPGPILDELCREPGLTPEEGLLCGLRSVAALQEAVAIESVRLAQRMVEAGLESESTGEGSGPELFVGAGAGSVGLTAGVFHKIQNGISVGGAVSRVSEEERTLQPLGELTGDTLAGTFFAAFQKPSRCGSLCFKGRGVLAAGRQRLDITRQVTQPGTPPQTARASPDGRFHTTKVRLGLGSEKGPWTFGGFCQGAWTAAELDAYSESGAPGLEWAVPSQEVKSLLGKLGVELAHQRPRGGGGSGLSWGLRGGYLHELAADPRRITAHLATNPSHPFTITTPAPDRDYFDLEVHAQHSWHTGWTLYFKARKELARHDQTLDSVQLGVHFKL